MDWLPLNKLVYEVSGFPAPSLWYSALFNLHLFAQNVVSDFFPVFPAIWPFAQHTLVGDDTDCEEVHRNTVVLATHYFGSHVAGRA